MITKLIFLKKYATYLGVLNTVLFILQLIFVSSKAHVYLNTIHLPFIVYIEIGFAFFVQILLCLMLTWLQTELLWGLMPFYSNKKQLLQGLIVIFAASVILMLGLNCYFFPLSKHSQLVLHYLPYSLILFLSVFSGIILLLLMAIRLWSCRIFAGFIALVGCGLFLFNTSPKIMDNKRPNLIIIGVDSLSPESVNPQLTPTLYQFLDQSVHFEKVISPLARTYAAWTTILTGLYPIHHLARENLYPIQSVKHNASFAWILQQQDYQTMFASDDRRFNNLGQEFGFQQVIGPSIGISDAILGSFYDFPLSNFLINMPFSQHILPYNAYNRASYFSYYPTTFDNIVQHSLNQLDPHKPIFLAVHFTLPHWPYLWAPSPFNPKQDLFSITDREEAYRQSIHKADEQVSTLLGYLKQKEMLNNSMVVVLSDHGEAIYKNGSRKTDPALYQGSQPSMFKHYITAQLHNDLQKSFGHGSDLLSPSQFECLLGFKIFKHHKMMTSHQSISTWVSLLDIAPTIADFFHFSLTSKPDGISLLPAILNHQEITKNRLFMLESGLAPNEILSEEKVVQLVHKLYRINVDGRLEIRPDRFALINATKLYGALQNQWLLALYPNQHNYIPVLLNLDNGEWSDDIHSSFIKNSPFNAMLLATKQFYKLLEHGIETQ